MASASLYEGFISLTRPLFEGWAGSRTTEQDLNWLLRRLSRRDNSQNIERDVATAVKLARKISRERKIGYNAIHADPLKITDALERYPQTTASTIIAAVLYPVLRAEGDRKFDRGHFREIEDRFRHKPDVAQIVRNTLQLRDTHLHARISSFEHTAPIKARIAIPEPAWFENFRLMLRDKVEHTDALLIRMTQWLIYLQELDRDKTPPDEFNRALYMTEHFYVIMAGTYGFKELRDDLEDQLLRMRDPQAYQAAYAQIVEAENYILNTEGKAFIENPNARRRIVCEIIEKSVADAIANGIVVVHKDDLINHPYRDVCAVEARVKTVSSVHEKTKRKPYYKNADVIGARIITRSHDDLNNEQRNCGRLHSKLKRKFPVNEGYEDDYMGKPREVEIHLVNDKGEPLLDADGNQKIRIKKIGRRKSGYESIHNNFRIVTAKDEIADPSIHAKKSFTLEMTAETEDEFERIKPAVPLGSAEIQITGWLMHKNNEKGSASHDTVYKKRADIRDPNDNMISVYTMGNEIIRLPKGMTVREMAAHLDSRLPAILKGAIIDRRDLFNPIPIGADILDVPLITGDQVELILDKAVPATAARDSNVVLLPTPPSSPATRTDVPAGQTPSRIVRDPA